MGQDKRTAHTPGPWTCEHNGHHTSDSNGRALSMTQNSGYWTNPETKQFERWDRPEGEIKANGLLIASAPELLVFVQIVLAEQLARGEYGDANYIRMAQTLIAKATGVSK